MLGLVLAGLLALSSQSSTLATLSSSTVIAVKTAPSTVEQPFGGEWTLMTLGEAHDRYDILVKIENPTQRQVQLLAALRLAIGTIEGNQQPSSRCDDTPQRCATLTARPAVNQTPTRNH